MKKLIVITAAFMITAGAHGQGRFAVNFKGDGNDIRFVNFDGSPLAGTEGYQVEIFAGPDVPRLQPVGSLALNRTTPASELGYPNPTAQTFSIGSGDTIFVGWARR